MPNNSVSHKKFMSSGVLLLLALGTKELSGGISMDGDRTQGWMVYNALRHARISAFALFGLSPNETQPKIVSIEVTLLLGCFDPAFMNAGKRIGAQ